MTHVACNKSYFELWGHLCIHAKETVWQPDVQSCIMPGLSRYLVQEFNVGTVLTLTEYSKNDCRNHYERLCKYNNGLLASIHNICTIKLNVDIALITVQSTCITCRRSTPHTFTRLVHFKIVNNRDITNNILQKMELVNYPINDGNILGNAAIFTA